MNKEELSALVAEILAGMGEAPQVKAGPYKAENPGPEQRDMGGAAEDVSAIDLRKLYLTKNPQKGAEYLKLKSRTPARLGMGKAGPRYKTVTMLRFRADHAAAQDAVFSQVPEDFAGKNGLVPVQTKCKDKEECKEKKSRYLRREFSYTKFQQTLILPEDVVKDHINASMCDGVLCIELPRKAPEEKKNITKVIEIK